MDLEQHFHWVSLACGKHTNPRPSTWMTANNAGSLVAPRPTTPTPTLTPEEEGGHANTASDCLLICLKQPIQTGTPTERKSRFQGLSPRLELCCLGRRSGRRWRLSWLPAHTASQRRQVVINTLQITFTGPTRSARVLLLPGLYSALRVYKTLSVWRCRVLRENLWQVLIVGRASWVFTVPGDNENPPFASARFSSYDWLQPDNIHLFPSLYL